ncbi:MAG: helix-hairpin-helix domain-containing protein [Nitrospira sp.]|nr:helix-hairpin-helix domain-containing protein [Nitrospira sp.]
MVRSLLIKLAMLGVTLGSLIWIGSVTPIRQVAPHSASPVAVAQAGAASRQVLAPPSATLSRAGESTLVPKVPEVPTVQPVEVRESLAPREEPVHHAVARQVDLNYATASDLEALPGIGPKLAQRVIEHRVAKGPFTKVEDLRQVKGIGRKKFDRLRPHVLVTNTRSLSRHKGTL